MSKYDRMDVFAGDPEPDCFGEVRGCLVPHCYWAKYCYDRMFRKEVEDLVKKNVR